MPEPSKNPHLGTALGAIAGVVALLALVMPFTSTVANAVASRVSDERIAAYIEANPEKFRGPAGLVGKTGPNGEAGSRGERGADGRPGITGETGPQGPRGVEGKRGDPGPRGDRGPQGEIGTVGERGPEGAKGAAGPKGDTGSTGNDGQRGPVGPPGNVPVGTILAWHPKLFGVSNKTLPNGWARCDGQQGFPIGNGRTVDLPDLNGAGRFLRGGTVSGTLQQDTFQGHYHKIETVIGTNKEGGPNITGLNVPPHVTGGRQRAIKALDDGVHGAPRVDNETRPKNMSVVWIIRVK